MWSINGFVSPRIDTGLAHITEVDVHVVSKARPLVEIMAGKEAASQHGPKLPETHTRKVYFISRLVHVIPISMGYMLQLQ